MYGFSDWLGLWNNGTVSSAGPDPARAVVTNESNLGERRGRTGLRTLEAGCAGEVSGLAHSGFAPDVHHASWVAPKAVALD